jgi:hypothetical protein
MVQMTDPWSRCHTHETPELPWSAADDACVDTVRVEIMGPGTYENVGKSQVCSYYDQSHDLHPHP